MSWIIIYNSSDNLIKANIIVYSYHFIYLKTVLKFSSSKLDKSHSTEIQIIVNNVFTLTFGERYATIQLF